MYSLTINPDRSAVYTEMVDGVQLTYNIPSWDFEAIMAAAPIGESRWVDLDNALDTYIASKG